MPKEYDVINKVRKYGRREKMLLQIQNSNLNGTNSTLTDVVC